MNTALQAAGHGGAQQGGGLFIKPTTQNEIDFYQWIVHQSNSLSSFVPLFMGTLCEQNLDKNPADISTQPLIVLEDLCEGFEKPSILDVKLGSRLWDQYASPEKRERLMAVSRTTTSGSLGFRIAGMTLIDGNGERIRYGKEFGRAATVEDIDDHFRKFWPLLDSDDYMVSTLVSIVAQLEQLHLALSEEPLEVHSASVLIIYEGDAAELKRKADRASQTEHKSIQSEETENDDPIVDKNKLVEVRLIDFAHTTRANQADEDVLNGLSQLIKVFKRILAELGLKDYAS